MVKVRSYKRQRGGMSECLHLSLLWVVGGCQMYRSASEQLPERGFGFPVDLWVLVEGDTTVS